MDGKITAAAGAFGVSFQKTDTGELIRTVPVGFRADELRFYGQGRYVGVFLKKELELYIETATGRRLEKIEIDAKADPGGPVPAVFDLTRLRNMTPPKPDELGYFIHHHVNRAAIVPERGLLLAETEGYYREQFLGQPTPQVISLDLKTFTVERRNGICSLSLGEKSCAVLEGYVGMEGLQGPIFVWDSKTNDYLLTHDPRPESDFEVWYGVFDFIPDVGILCELQHRDRRPLLSLYGGRGGKTVHLRDVPIRTDEFWGYGMIHRGASLLMTDETNDAVWRLLFAAFSDKRDTIDLLPIGKRDDGYYRSIDLYPRRKIAVIEVGSRTKPLASSIVLFDVKKKAIVKEFPESSCARVSGDETLLAVAGKRLTIYAAATWEKLKEFDADPFMANSIFFSPDKKYLGACTKDSRVVFYEIETGRRSLTFVFTDRGEAIASTEDNYFMATPGGMKFVGCTEGDEPVTDRGFVDSFNRPDVIKPVIQKILASFSAR